MPKFSINIIIFCIITIALYSNNSLAYEDIVKNGDFSEGLNGWDFVDKSQTDQSCPDAYSENYIINNRFGIHSYSAIARGNLYQIVPKNLPHVFEFDYELQGGCAAVNVRLKYNSTNIFSYELHSNTNLAAVSSIYFNRTHLYSGTVAFSWSGKVKIEFDYENGKVLIYFNNQKIDEYNLILAYIDEIKLEGANGCCDGRDNGYAYFDNVSLIPYSFPAEQEIPLPTNHSIIITTPDWENVISAGSVHAPVLVSETGSVTPQIQRFIQDYKPDYIYTIGFDSGLNGSFEIAKEDVRDCFSRMRQRPSMRAAGRRGFSLP